MPAYVHITLALIGGACLAVQSAINARLSLATAHPVTAAAISFGVGFLCLIIGSFAFRAPVPEQIALASMPKWGWIGGLLGATYVALAILTVPRLGAATVISCVVAGQLTASLLLDHFGSFGLAQHGINLWRVAGAIMLTVGAILIRMN